MTRRLWLVNLLLALGCTTIGGLDLATGHPMLAPLMFASAGVNGLVGAFNKRHYARPPEPPHRPDYAKIRRLELELGLRDPDPSPATTIEGGPFLRHTQPRPNPQTGLPPSRFDPRSTGQHYRLEVPPPVTSPNEWAYCPVCTRRHAGRCAG